VGRRWPRNRYEFFNVYHFSSYSEQKAKYMFIRTVTVTIPAGREEELYAFWEWASAIVKQQPGYIRGRLWRDVADPRRFTEAHEWEHEEDSNAYRAGEQFREVIGRLAALSQEPLQAVGYELVL
jgi:heme-degrading monooxygenase HmoA